MLDGGGGGDTMRGYGGDDTYVINNSSDLVFEASGQGTDIVNSRVSYVLAAGQSVETLKFTSASGTANLNLTGNEFAQTLTGNAGNNILDGGGGGDTMRGYAGDDTYVINNTKAISSSRPRAKAPTRSIPACPTCLAPGNRSRRSNSPQRPAPET